MTTTGLADFEPYRHNNKPTGFLSKDKRIFYTRRNRKTHLALRHKAYGIQNSMFKDLVAGGVEWVYIEETVPGTPTTLNRYKTPVTAWQNTGIKDVLNSKDGIQIFLSLEHMRKHYQVA